MTDRPVAVITGASSGIGWELAKVFADHQYDIVAVARRADRLAQLKQELDKVNVYPVVLDLAKAKGPRKLLEATEELGVTVDTLVNNAGTAFQGRFADMSESQTKSLLDLNVRTLTQCTQLFLPQMRANGHGKILNVASIVGFQAIPSMALYAASKAFVLSFSESLAEELAQEGITVSALCPGLTKTEMVSDLGTDQLLNFPGADLFMDNPGCVAKEAFDALQRKQVITVPGFFNKLIINWAEYQPRWLKRGLAGFAARATW